MEKKTLSFGSALIAVVLSLGTIIVGKLLWSLDTTIVLLLSAMAVHILSLKMVDISGLLADTPANVLPVYYF